MTWGNMFHDPEFVWDKVDTQDAEIFLHGHGEVAYSIGDGECFTDVPDYEPLQISDLYITHTKVGFGVAYITNGFEEIEFATLECEEFGRMPPRTQLPDGVVNRRFIPGTDTEKPRVILYVDDKDRPKFHVNHGPSNKWFSAFCVRLKIEV